METDNSANHEPFPNGQPMVSIICNTYNHERYISDALEGFLMQQCDFPFEILVHDDASTDKTADIIRDYEARFPTLVKPVYQLENQWKFHDFRIFHLQRNRAMGKYIALCEGDDYWTDPLKLQKQVDFMEKNPDYSMCFHKSAIQNNTNEPWKNRLYRHLRQGEYTGFDVLAKWTVPTASVMYRSSLRSFLLHMALPKGILYIDIMTYLTLAEQGKLYCLGDTMSVYRLHGESIINRPDPNRGKKYITHLRTIQTLFGGKYKEIIDHLIADMYVSAAWTDLQKGRYSNVSRLLWGSLQISPMAIPRRCLTYIENRVYALKSR